MMTIPFRKTTNLFVLLIMLLTSSCSVEYEITPDVDRLAVQFSATGITATPQTRTTINQQTGETEWAPDDLIGIFMTGSAIADNYIYKVSGNGTLIPYDPSNTLYYPPGGGTVNFIAYYPRKDNQTLSTYPVDISDQRIPAAIDLLYSSAMGKSETSGPVALTFRHVLSKLVMTVQNGTGVDLSNLTVTIKGMNTQADFDLSSGTFVESTITNSANITPFCSQQPDGTKDAIYEALLLPGDITDKTVVEFKLNNETRTWKISNDLTALAPSCKYTYTVNLKKTGISIYAEGVPAGTSVKVNFTDGTSQTDSYNLTNGIIITNPTKTVKSIVIAGYDDGKGNSTILIGRKADKPIYLKFDNKKLTFRDPVNDSIPIGSYAEFQLIYGLDNRTNSYKQEADLDLMNEEWQPIAVKNPSDIAIMDFYGTFDGAGFQIDNLKINKPENSNNYRGLFRGNKGTIKNVHIVSGSIVSGGSYVGGVCGVNYGAIIACYNNSTISGADQVGGVCGANSSGGSIMACYNNSTVSGKNQVGGVCGANNSSSFIIACYNIGNISGNGIFIGGVAGFTTIPNTITACYAKTAISINGGVSGTIFSGNAWPVTGNTGWSKVTSGGYWKDLGSWNNGNPIYPKLWWE